MSSACKHVLQHSHGAIMKLLEHGAAGRLPLQQVRIGLSFLSERSQDPNTQLESLGRQCQRYLTLRDEVERLGQQGLLFFLLQPLLSLGPTVVQLLTGACLLIKQSLSPPRSKGMIMDHLREQVPHHGFIPPETSILGRPLGILELLGKVYRGPTKLLNMIV